MFTEGRGYRNDARSESKLVICSGIVCGKRKEQAGMCCPTRTYLRYLLRLWHLMPVAGCGSREKRACAGEFLFFLTFCFKTIAFSFTTSVYL